MTTPTFEKIEQAGRYQVGPFLVTLAAYDDWSSVTVEYDDEGTHRTLASVDDYYAQAKWQDDVEGAATVYVHHGRDDRDPDIDHWTP